MQIANKNVSWEKGKVISFPFISFCHRRFISETISGLSVGKSIVGISLYRVMDASCQRRNIFSFRSVASGVKSPNYSFIRSLLGMKKDQKV